jgi:hypothetical protein
MRIKLIIAHTHTHTHIYIYPRIHSLVYPQVSLGLCIIRRPYMQVRLKALSARLESMLRQQLVLNQHQLEDKQQLYRLQLDSHQAALTDWSEPVLHGYITNPFSACSAFENFQQVLSQVFLKPSKSYIYLLKHVHAVLNSMCAHGAPPLEIVRAAKDLRDACEGISEMLVSGSMSSFAKCEEERDALVRECVGLIAQSVVLQENRISRADMNMHSLCEKYDHLYEIETSRTNKEAAACRLDTQNLPCSEVRLIFRNITIHKKDLSDTVEISRMTLFVLFFKATLLDGSGCAMLDLVPDTGHQKWRATQPELRLTLQDPESFNVTANLRVAYIERLSGRGGMATAIVHGVGAAINTFSRFVSGNTHEQQALPQKEIEFQTSVVKVQGLSDRPKTSFLSSGKVDNSSTIYFETYAVQKVRLTVSGCMDSVLNAHADSFSVQAHTHSQSLNTMLEILRSDTLEVDCAVCVQELVDPVIVSPCKHVFCRGCILRWLQEKDDCPNCRAEGPKIEADAEDAQKRVMQAVFLRGPKSAGEYFVDSVRLRIHIMCSYIYTYTYTMCVHIHIHIHIHIIHR